MGVGPQQVTVGVESLADIAVVIDRYAASQAGIVGAAAERVEPVLIVLRAGDEMVAAVVTRAGRKRIDPKAAVDDRAGGGRADDDARARTRLHCLRH